MLQFDLFVTVFYAAVRSASNSIRFCKKQLLSCLLAIYIGRGWKYRQMDTFRPNWRSGLYVLVWTVWAILSFTGVVTFIYSNF